MMIKHLTSIILFISFALMVSKPTFALSQLGHQVVCQLAFEHLASSQKNKINLLLNAIPKAHQHLINDYNDQKRTTPINFARACTWPDIIKRLDVFKKYNRWHYMNVPRNHVKIKVNDCEKNCLPQAILKHTLTLSHSKNSHWQQAQSLLFLGHWLGDIHQPLHISFADDLGGNKVKISNLNSKCRNLHWYWDECILYRGKHSRVKWLTQLNTIWNENSQPNWQPEQVWQWADESFQLIKETSFHYCQLRVQDHCQKLVNKIKLPPDYLAHHQPIMAQRLLQAAQRLTKLLEATL